MKLDSMAYVLDANVFMEAACRYYDLDLALPFRNFLRSEASNDVLGSIDKVYEEIMRGNDQLRDWSRNEFSQYFCSTEIREILSNYQRVAQHARSVPQHDQRAKDVFMQASNADTWILAFALTHDVTVVTHETLDRNIVKRIPIPNICEDFQMS